MRIMELKFQPFLGHSQCFLIFFYNSNLLHLTLNDSIDKLSHSRGIIDKFFHAILMPRETEEHWYNFWPDWPTDTLRVNLQSL